MGHLLTMADPPPNVGAVWLTPYSPRNGYAGRSQQYGGPSLFVIGTADPHFDPVVLEKMQVATIGEAVVVETRTTVWIFREILSPRSAPSSASSRPSAGSWHDPENKV